MKQASAVNKLSKPKVLSINCQSIQSVEKRARFYALLEQHNSDTVSWLYKLTWTVNYSPYPLALTPQLEGIAPLGLKVVESRGWGGGTLIFSHIRRLGLFLGSKF